jgi:hypothetical protein
MNIDPDEIQVTQRESSWIHDSMQPALHMCLPGLHNQERAATARSRWLEILATSLAPRKELGLMVERNAKWIACVFCDAQHD